jgi:hypothetical protein
MDMRDIEEFYERIGLGTQSERDAMLQGAADDRIVPPAFFIIDSPNTSSSPVPFVVQ